MIAGATKAGGVERSLPWTEMRDTNKTEISLAAMALVVTLVNGFQFTITGFTCSVEFHLVGCVVVGSGYTTVFLVAGFSTYCCYCYYSSLSSPPSGTVLYTQCTVHTGVLVLNCEEST